jgi:hypothetical protein
LALARGDGVGVGVGKGVGCLAGWVVGGGDACGWELVAGEGEGELVGWVGWVEAFCCDSVAVEVGVGSMILTAIAGKDFSVFSRFGGAGISIPATTANTIPWNSTEAIALPKSSCRSESSKGFSCLGFGIPPAFVFVPTLAVNSTIKVFVRWGYPLPCRKTGSSLELIDIQNFIGKPIQEFIKL